ncbi:flagellin [Selenomonas sp. AE3005]|uniref:flagellin n=1 Tax=Selenomonas sp. AE3005 TaxID=1485543 RepID=UPI0004836FA7|nr:flagellin [Selenomonas sp. AE3005]
MAMNIMNNPNTALSLSELNKNTSQLTKDLKKITSGLRINSAKDDASGYAISENMQVRLRGLEQCTENTEVGSNMLKVAAGAVDQQLELMKKLRENALKASDDTYSQQDRDVLQSETTQLLMQSNNISWETNYNGIRLLDGITDTMEKVVTREWVPDNVDSTISNSENSTNALLSIQDQSPQNTSTDNTISLRSVNLRGLLGSSNDTVDLDPTQPPVPNNIRGLFPPNNWTKEWVSGTINGYKAFNPAERLYDWPNVNMRTRPIVYSPGTPGRFDPPIYSRDINGNEFEIAYNGISLPNFNIYQQCYIKDGRGNDIPVGIIQERSDLFAISLNGQDLSSGARGWSVDINFSSATKNGQPLDLPKDLNNQSITIFCPYVSCNQYVGIKFETNRPAGTGQLYTPSQATNERTNYQYKDAKVYAVGIGNESQTPSEIMRNVFLALKDAKGETDSDANYVILNNLHQTGLFYDPVTDTYSIRQVGNPPVIYNGGLGSISGGGEDEYGGDYVPPTPDPPTPDPPTPDPPTPDPPTPDPPTPDPPTPDPPTPDPPTPDPGGRWIERVTYIPRKYPHKDLIIQSDTKASLHTRLKLPNTTLDALFPLQNTYFTLEPTPTDYPSDWPPEYDQLTLEEKRAKWRDEIWPYPKPGATASGSCVRTKAGAIKFLNDLDQAIKYLLDSSTTLGAQINRLEAMKNNLTIAHEQTTSSESTIRDADMAKTITNYHKNNIISQAAQSMLTQANKSNSEILNLLR